MFAVCVLSYSQSTNLDIASSYCKTSIVEYPRSRALLWDSVQLGMRFDDMQYLVLPAKRLGIRWTIVKQQILGDIGDLLLVASRWL